MWHFILEAIAHGNSHVQSAENKMKNQNQWISLSYTKWGTFIYLWDDESVFIGSFPFDKM